MLPASDAPSSFAPQCSRHPGVVSEATCTRCGNFLCHSCRASLEPVLCEACAALARDPLKLRSMPFTIGGSMVGAGRMFWGAFPVIGVLAVLFGIPEVLMALAFGRGPNFELVTLLFEVVIGLIGTIAVVWAMAAVAEGRKPSLKDALARGTGEWGQVFVNRLRAGIWIGLYSLLLIVPGVLKALALLLVVPSAVLNNAQDPLGVSEELTDGHKGRLFLLCLATGVTLLAVLMATGFMAGMINGLVGAPEAMLFGIDLVSRLALYLFEGVTLAAYYGLLRTREAEA